MEAEKRDALTSKRVNVAQQSALGRLRNKGGTTFVRPLSWFDSFTRHMSKRPAKFLPSVDGSCVPFRSSLTLVRLGDPSDSVRDVSKDDKGRIFQDTFVRGVKVIWIFDG